MARFNSAPQQNDDSWKAQGFLNFYLPSKDGKEKKLGAIPLKDAVAGHADLRKWIEANPERVVKLLASLTITYQSANPQQAAVFALED